MNARAVGRITLIAIAVGGIALVGEASGVAPAWAVLAGLAVSVTGAPPVVHRGVTTLGTAVAVAMVLAVLDGAGAPMSLAVAVVTVVVVAGAGIARLRDDARAPALAVLLGGGVVLAGVHVAGAVGVAEVAPALGGLVAGLLPMQVGEVVSALRASTSRETDGEAHATVDGTGDLRGDVGQVRRVDGADPEHVAGDRRSDGTELGGMDPDGVGSDRRFDGTEAEHGGSVLGLDGTAPDRGGSGDGAGRGFGPVRPGVDGGEVGR